MARLTTSRLIVLIAFLGILAMALRPAVDTDTWWHLRAGAWTVDHGRILTHDEFSSTRLGWPWINHSWLAQVGMILLWRAAGYAGLNLATAALVLLAFILVYLQCEGSVYLKAFTLVLAAAASAIYWSARPQMLSFVLASVFACILHLYRRRGVNRLWLLPLLMALWVNLHGGFAIGLMLLVMTLFAQTAENLWRSLLAAIGRRDRAEAAVAGVVGWHGVAWLAGVTLACAAVLPFTPYGLTMYTYPLRTVSIGVLQDFIQEWQSPNFHLMQMQVVIWLVLALFAATGLAGRRIDFTDLVLVCGWAYMGFMAARNIPVLALVAAPVISRQAAAGLADLAAVWPRLGRVLASPAPAAGRQYPVVNWSLLGLMILLAVIRAGEAVSPQVNLKAEAGSLPAGAVQFLRRTILPGVMFNNYNWGGYLAWHLYPDYLVYVDGRTDLYDDEFLREYLRVYLGRAGYAAVLARERVETVVIESGSLLDERLTEDSRWREIYRDELAVVYRLDAGSMDR